MQTERPDAQEAGGLTSEADYIRQWRDLRFRSWLVLLLFVLFIPAMGFGHYALDRISPRLGERGSFWVLGIWAATAVIASFYQISFRCPRCGGWFGSSDGWTNPFAGHCLHCGQKRHGSPDELR